MVSHQSLDRSGTRPRGVPRRTSPAVDHPARQPSSPRWWPLGGISLLTMPRTDLLALQRIVGNQAVQRLIQAPLAAAPVSPSLLIQCERLKIPALVNQNAPTISYKQVDEFYRNHIQPQIDEFWADVDNEDNIGEDLTRWAGHYTERMEKLWTEIETNAPGGTDVYTYAIPLPQVMARQGAVPDRVYLVFVTINNIRNALNTSLTNHPRQAKEKEEPKYEDDTVGVPTMTEEELDEKKPMIIYRQMGQEEAKKILDAYGMRASEKRHQNKPVLGTLLDDNQKRYWTTTTTEHSKKFVNEGDVDHEAADKVVLRFELDRQEYKKIYKQSLPAYQTKAYDSPQSLIHQEKLVKSNRAATRTQEQLDLIAKQREHYNIGFSYQDLQAVDSALKSVQLLNMKTL